MFAARGSVMVSRLGNGRCGRVGCRIDVAPSKRVGVEHPYPSHLFYRLPIVPFPPKEIDPLSNSERYMSCSRSWHLPIFSLS